MQIDVNKSLDIEMVSSIIKIATTGSSIIKIATTGHAAPYADAEPITSRLDAVIELLGLIALQNVAMANKK